MTEDPGYTKGELSLIINQNRLKLMVERTNLVKDQTAIGNRIEEIDEELRKLNDSENIVEGMDDDERIGKDRRR